MFFLHYVTNDQTFRIDHDQSERVWQSCRGFGQSESYSDLLTTTLYGSFKGRFFRAHIQSFLPPGHPDALYLDTDRGYVGIQTTLSHKPFTLAAKNHTYYGGIPSNEFPHDKHEMSLLTYFMIAYMLETT